MTNDGVQLWKLNGDCESVPPVTTMGASTYLGLYYFNL